MILHRDNWALGMHVIWKGKADKKHDLPKCMHALTRSSMYTLHNYCPHKYIAQILDAYLWESPHLISQRMGEQDSILHWWWLTCLPLMSSSSVIEQYNGHVSMHKINIYNRVANVHTYTYHTHIHTHIHTPHTHTHTTHTHTQTKEVYEHKDIPCPTSSFQSV